jgi:hypothetical protein
VPGSFDDVALDYDLGLPHRHRLCGTRRCRRWHSIARGHSLSVSSPTRSVRPVTVLGSGIAGHSYRGGYDRTVDRSAGGAHQPGTHQSRSTRAITATPTSSGSGSTASPVTDSHVPHYSQVSAGRSATECEPSRGLSALAGTPMGPNTTPSPRPVTERGIAVGRPGYDQHPCQPT